MFKTAPRPIEYLFAKKQTIIAHRGGAHEAPENTMAAFEKAITGGYPIELDVRPTKDGCLVVFHDETLERTTNGAGRVVDRTVEQLKLLDAGHGERIPTLKEALEMVRSRVPVIIEAKCKGWRGSAHTLVDALVHDVAAAAARESVVVSSFNPYLLHLVKKKMSHLLRGLVFSRPSFLSLKMMAAVSDILMPEYRLVNQDFVNRMHAEGFKIFPWTIDHASTGGTLLVDGVDGLISNCPHALEEALSH